MSKPTADIMRRTADAPRTNRNLKCSQMSSRLHRTYLERGFSPDAETDYCFFYLESPLAPGRLPFIKITLPRYSQARAPVTKI
jgi:hypothetical protein